MDNKMDNQEEIRLRLVRPDTSTHTELPVATSGVSAGFPSPADDHLDPPLDLNRELVRNPGATFFARVAGDSMQDDGIADGDRLPLIYSPVDLAGGWQQVPRPGSVMYTPEAAGRLGGSIASYFLTH